jgi:hypothetical protein
MFRKLKIFSQMLNCMIRRAKGLAMDKGFLSSSDSNPGKTLNRVTVEVVKTFSNNDSVSIVMPGQKRLYIS